jgi:2-keto-4-pentenoate hydratase/2-oxohepta-3-ene-1,7-dioic acid hydratase in catechol pathway
MERKISVPFRLLSYAAADGTGRAGLLIDDQVYDLTMTMEAAGGKLDLQTDSVISVLHDWGRARPQIDLVVSAIQAGRVDFGKIRRPLAEVKLFAPILYPGVLYCAGANYRDHLLEMTGKSADKNRQPFFFLKTVAGTIIGPGEAIRLPPYSSKVDWEAEIALVIGGAGKNIPADRAMDHVAGFTICRRGI